MKNPRMNNQLQFNDTFKSVIEKEILSVINGNQIEIKRKFEAWDSYSFLVSIDSGREYVFKIFRFPEWPPQGKIEKVISLLSNAEIPHEKIIHLEYKHNVFNHGWQLSEYIPGGTAKELIDNKVINRKHYHIKVGEILRELHKIKLDFFGSLNDEPSRFEEYKKYVLHEVNEHTIQYLPERFTHHQETLNLIKQEIVLSLDNQEFDSPRLVHDDVGTRNLLWNFGQPLLIDWVDSLAAPSNRDFATLTYREDTAILPLLEKGYESKINLDSLRLHQLMRFFSLAKYYLEDNDIYEFEKMIYRGRILIKSDIPYGAK